MEKKIDEPIPNELEAIMEPEYPPQTDEELTEEVKAVVFESKPEAPKKEEEKPSDVKVKVKVLVGTLVTEVGEFSKGDVFTVSKERAKQFDPKDIEILK